MIRYFMISASVLASAVALAQERPQVVVASSGHTSVVEFLSFADSGKTVLSMSRDRSVRRWDAETGAQLEAYFFDEVHTDCRGPYGLFAGRGFSPDGRSLGMVYRAQGAAGGEIRYVTLSPWRVRWALARNTTEPSAFIVSPDGRRAAFSGYQQRGDIAVVDATTGQVERVLQSPNHERVDELYFSPDGRQLASRLSEVVRIWSVGSGTVTGNLEPSFPVLRMAWSSNGECIALSDAASPQIQIWSPSGRMLGQIALGDSFALSLVFTPDSRWLLVTSTDTKERKACACRLVELPSGRVRSTAFVPGAVDARSAISPDGTLAATGAGSDIFLWDLKTAKVVRRLGGQRFVRNDALWGTTGRKFVLRQTPSVNPAWSDGVGRSEALTTERAFDPQTLEFMTTPVAPAASRAPDITVEREWQPAPRTVLKRSGQVIATGPSYLGPENITARAVLPTGEFLTGQSNGSVTVWTIEGSSLKEVCSWNCALKPVTSLSVSPDGRFVLCALEDGVAFVVNPKDVLGQIPETKYLGQPPLAMFFEGDDWIAWTPQGYYACSAGGERLMGWRVSNGPDRLASSYPAVQVRKSLYRPDVIRRLLDAGSVERALALVEEAGGKKSPRRDVADVLPPLVAITSPDQAQSEVQEPLVPLRFVANPTARHPLTAVRLLLDGRPYPGTDHLMQYDPPREGEVREAWTVKLEPGQHALAVQAESAVSKSVSEPVQVMFGARGLVRGESGIATTQAPVLPSLYVLTIGISSYPGSLKLDYAAKDAQAIARVCQIGCPPLYRKLEVKTLTDAQATRREILSGLTWLRKQITQNDVARVAFAGHGARDADGSFCLLPADVEMDDLLATAVSGEQLKRTLGGMPGKFVLLLDACHSGAVDGENRRAADSLTDDLVRDLVTDDYGVIVMCSAMGREFALESSAIQHGFFTYAIVEGLSGKGDYNHDGVVHLNELDLYVTDRVKELAQGRQHPVTARPTSIRSFPLAKVN